MTALMKALGLVTMLSFTASGCALTAGATAGAVAGSEIAEEDDEFDPLENTEIGEEVYE
jgi:hypothetical protein